MNWVEKPLQVNVTMAYTSWRTAARMKIRTRTFQTSYRLVRLSTPVGSCLYRYRYRYLNRRIPGKGRRHQGHRPSSNSRRRLPAIRPTWRPTAGWHCVSGLRARRARQNARRSLVRAEGNREGPLPCSLREFREPHPVSDALRLPLPIAEAEQIRIDRV